MYEKLFNSIDIDISNTNSEAISTEDKNNIANNVRKEIRICINESFNNILKNELLRIKKKEIEDLIKKENPSFDFGDLGTFIDLDDKLIVYEINSMISTENFYSKILEKKYKNIYTDARKLLKVLTLEKYNISNKNIFTFYPSKIKNFKKKTCNITALIKVSQHKFGTDITKRFNLFLEACNKSDKFSTQNNKNKYYISLYDCIPFVLHYMFYEGKKFLEENDNPKFSEENSCSMKSYRIVLSHVLKLFTDKNVSNPCYIDRIFEAAQLYRIDNEFNFFKISRLTYQREQFMNEENFNSIFGFFNQETKEEQTLRQSKDIEKLQKYINLRQEKIKKTKEIIEQEIFKDKDFIDFCLSTNYPEPFYILYIYIKAYMARYDFQNSLLIHEERKSLTNAISECKQYAKNYINSISKFMDKKTEEIINKKDLSEDELFELININDIEYIFAKFMTKEDYEKNSISYWQEYYFKNREPLNTLQQVNSNPENEDTSYISFLQKIAYQHTPKLLKEE